jgi:HPt (histidine-containing phosphotransfer) domain-containing protein
LAQWQGKPAGDSVNRSEMTGHLRGPAVRYLSARVKEIPVFHDLLERLDFAELQRLAHNLKGTGTSYGFPNITRFGSAMEQASKKRDIQGVSREIEDLTKYVELARAAAVGTHQTEP